MCLTVDLSLCVPPHLEMHVFQRMGVLHVGQKIEEQADFEKIYKNGAFIFL